MKFMFNQPTNTNSVNTDSDILDKLKFAGHILFIIVEFYLAINILLSGFNLLFYFGFIATIFIAFVIVSLVYVKDSIIEKISNIYVGDKLLICMDYILNICKNTLFIIKDKLLIVLEKIYDTTSIINNYLSNNTKSQEVQQKITASITKKVVPLAMKYGMEQMFKPSGSGNTLNTPTGNSNSLASMLAQFKSISQRNIVNNPESGFNNSGSRLIPTTFTNSSSVKTESVQISSNIYKNIPTTNNSDNMSFLNTTIVEDDVIDDDLDDELEDCLNDCLEELEKKTNTPVQRKYTNRPPNKNKGKKKNKNKQTTKVEIKPSVLAENTKTQEETRLACKKKLAEKRSARLGKTTNSLNSANAKNMSESQIKDIVMQKDNLELIMKEFPLDANGKPEITQEKIKKIAHTLMNK